MFSFFNRWRIGQKILVSFGVVGLLFLGVIWHYHLSLENVIKNYEYLYGNLEARKSYALDIQEALTEARRAEKDFLLHREERFLSEFENHLENLLKSADALAGVDRASHQAAQEIQALAGDYKYGFLAIGDAWLVKGLDHDSGLQGAFRRKVHELQRLSGYFSVDRLYYQLLQIRRGEKDLALRNDALYRDRVNGLITGFRNLVEESQLRMSEKNKLMAEIGIYEGAFASYADSVLADEDIRGGKGPFRMAAHRIEAILDSHNIPNLEIQVLELRRREKDYLLRHNAEYVKMVQQITQNIRDHIAAAAISIEDKNLLSGLLVDYERNFLALVEQDTHIEKLKLKTNTASERITPLVKQNADQAIQLLANNVQTIAESSRKSIRINLIIAAGATILGILFSTIIASGIVRPVRKMAGLLDELTHQVPSNRISVLPKSRDEINAMGESLNTLIDHRARFLEWWKGSMKEMDAQKNLNTATTDNEISTAIEALRSATLTKLSHIDLIRDQMIKNTNDILEVAMQLRTRDKMSVNHVAEKLEHSAHDISTLLAVVGDGRA